MSEYSEIIAAAGNVEVPAYLAIKSLGYTVTCEKRDEENEWWIAIRDQCRFIADNPIELLGLIAMRTDRGPNWKAEDGEIDSFISTYYPTDRNQIELAP